MDAKDYWEEKHKKYAKEEWINRPTIFAKFAIKYFPKNGRLLELGAGQGQDSRFFASKGYKVTATDFSSEALGLLKEKTNAEGLSIETKEVDISKDLPFLNQSFDIVYSHLALHYFDDETTRKVFSEIHRILKGGGILSALFNTIDDPEINESKKVEEGFFETPSGILKRYFSVDYLQDITNGLFEVVIADAKGETYKDEIKTLVRFVGRKK